MIHRSEIRSIVRDEMATNEIWNLFFGNPQMERAVTRNVNLYLDGHLNNLVTNSVHNSVTNATQKMKIDALDSVNALLKNDVRVQDIISSSVLRTQRMVNDEVTKGELQIKANIQKEIDGIVKHDRYNSVNKGFLDSLSLQCNSKLSSVQSQVTHEIDNLKIQNSNLTQEVRNKCTNMDQMQSDIKELQMNQTHTIITSTIFGAALGVGITSLLNISKK